MYSNATLKDQIIGRGIIRFHFLQSGNLKQITDDTDYVRINTYIGNDYEATIHNLYLLIVFH